VGPDGKAVKEAKIITRWYLLYGYKHEPAQSMDVRDGRFEIAGLDPERPMPVYFLSAAQGLGAMVELGGKKADGQPVTVRLEKCGSATVRFVDEKGQAVKDCTPFLELLMTPGVTFYEAFNMNALAADAAWMVNLDHTANRNPRPDAQGQFTLKSLIPGSTI